MPFAQIKPFNVGWRQGGCGARRLRGLSGIYDTIEMSRAPVTEAGQAAGCGLARRIIPTSDLLTETAFISP